MSKWTSICAVLVVFLSASLVVADRPVRTAAKAVVCVASDAAVVVTTPVVKVVVATTARAHRWVVAPFRVFNRCDRDCAAVKPAVKPAVKAAVKPAVKPKPLKLIA